jgi:hypothetical protein
MLTLRSKASMHLWLQFLLALGLALAGWISSLDTLASSAITSSIWAAAAIVAAHVVFRLFSGTR